MAGFCGVQQETVRGWIKRGCPGEVGTSPQGGRYDLSQIVQWCRQHVWVPKQNGFTGSTTRDAIKDKLLHIELADRTIDLKSKTGKLVEKQAVLAAVAQAFTIVRSRLEAIPAEAASSIPGHLKTEGMPVRRDLHRRRSHGLGVAIDLAYSWRLLKPNGILAIDDMRHPRYCAIRPVVRAMLQDLPHDVLVENEQLWVRKQQ